MEQGQSRGTSFLIRIWWETRDDPQDQPVWRGRIEHVPSRDITYFDNLADLIAYIELWTGALARDR